MCRWIVYVGEQTLLLEDLLIRPNHSIVKQVNIRFLPGLYYGLEENDKEELEMQATWINVHGFGVGWYTDTLAKFDKSVHGMRPAQFRTIAPISTDLAFEHLCKHTESKCTLAHIRDASFPPVVEVNNHPFIFGKYAFMHNGKVDSFAEILGNTDTEHLATLYFAHLDIIKAGILLEIRPQALPPHGVHLPDEISGQQDPFNRPGGIRIPFGIDSTDALLLALINTISDIHDIQFQHKVGPFTPGPFPPGRNFAGNKLNLCITDGGNQMLVSRWRDAQDGFPPSLYLSLTAGEKLNRKYFPVLPDPETSENIANPEVKIDSVRELVERYKYLPPTQQGRHVIVGSEPCTEYVADWGLFDQNQVVSTNSRSIISTTSSTEFLTSLLYRKLEYHYTVSVCLRRSPMLSRLN
ncbi:hypothetical protein J3R30DRAFT_768021 [Lentinula aciculospora]|uniref:Glutamine amidotransferase type-2 domain-containing protein n=1 Tax=Lentinula aciculospora TaxID=153920 RepID=A0A9W9DJZ2_9AGAR|nr:hypothetical protein J3R30DRAFT_768021 [Lentinula aciculospora]